MLPPTSYREYLLTDVLPFWLDHALDRECGGIFNYLDERGNVYCTDKQVWFQGRGLYILSRVYNEIDRDPKYLTAAKSLFDFLPKCGMPDGRLYFIATRDGREKRTAPDFFSESFAAIGCAEYFRATGDPEAKRRAGLYFSVMYKMYLADKEKPAGAEGFRFDEMAPAMILLSTAQSLRSLDPAYYAPIAATAAREVLRHKFDFGMLESIASDGSFVDTAEGRRVNPGHSLEAAWFLMAQGLYENDRSLIDAALEIVDVSMKIGLHDGGINAFADCKGLPVAELEWDMKIWWPQCEAMIANRLAYLLSGDKKYDEAFRALETYVFARYPDPANGEWYGYMHYDGTRANDLKGNISKGLFHMPRMLILMAETAALSPVAARDDFPMFL